MKKVLMNTIEYLLKFFHNYALLKTKIAHHIKKNSSFIAWVLDTVEPLRTQIYTNDL